ncbi:MAG: trimethylamine methyltransferase family protein, partial [Pseudomonadota bacterium]
MINATRKRHGGRAGNTRRSGRTAIAQLDWELPTLTDAPTEPLDAEGVQAIDDAAMRVLEEIGILFLNREAREILAAAGAAVDHDTFNVRMDREMVREYLAHAPASFDIVPRNPDRRITIGGRTITFGNVSSPPNCSDLDRGRRVGDRESFRDFIRFSQYFNCIHFCGG